MADDHRPGVESAHGIWQRGGADIENLPDPFGRDARPKDGALPPVTARPRRRWWRGAFNIVAALILVTLIWLIVTAPLSRALPRHRSVRERKSLGGNRKLTEIGDCLNARPCRHVRREPRTIC